MTKRNFWRNVVAIAIGLAAMTMFNSCSKDDDDKKGVNGNGNGSIVEISDVEFGVTMENGNVVETGGINMIGISYVERVIYVYKNGVFDHKEEENIWSNSEYAKLDYEDYKQYSSDYESVTLNGNTVKLVYKKSDTEHDWYVNVTAQELYEKLKADYDAIDQMK